MNKPQRKFIISLLSICTILPFAVTVIYLNSEYVTYVILLNIICFVLIVISYFIYIVKENNIYFRTSVLLIVPVIITLYFVSHTNILEISNKINFLLISKSKHISLLNEIKDCNYNNITVLRNRKYVRVDKYEYGNDSILLKLKIPVEKLNNIITKMESSGIIKINKHDEIIYFTSGGFIDSESGYAYSETNTNPVRNHAGSVFTWQKVDENWYYWYAD